MRGGPESWGCHGAGQQAVFLRRPFPGWRVRKNRFAPGRQKTMGKARDKRDAFFPDTGYSRLSKDRPNDRVACRKGRFAFKKKKFPCPEKTGGTFWHVRLRRRGLDIRNRNGTTVPETGGGETVQAFFTEITERNRKGTRLVSGNAPVFL
ncbi:hypothetical protein OFAG_02304 [Oxalobacter formigenes HOxBLS]|uniref:Uncharacterized protein n=1 Tax=Oxalobacter paraformigenes TaxID=556268 RepID=T5LE57_9BURK|nr:hypothetical protein OFAG_02304 [Oxalobacter paraformigenes]